MCAISTMRAVTTWVCFVIACGALGVVAEQPMTVRKIYVEKKTKNDLESQATGYIFRSDGDNPPILIKLGNGNIHQYDDVLKKAGITSNFESDRADFGDLNIPSKSSHSTVRSDYTNVNIPSKGTYSSVKTDYTDMNIPSKSSYSSVKSEYTDINIPAKSTYSTSDDSEYPPSSRSQHSQPYSKPAYSAEEAEEEIFKEAFKLIHSTGLSEESDFLPLHKSQPSVPEFENFRTSARIPGKEDGYGNADFQPPNSVSNYESSGEVNEPAAFDKPRTQPPRGYIASVFDVPNTDEVIFNHRQAPVKYPLKSHLPKPSYGQRITSEGPAEYNDEGSHEGNNDYSSHYTADYHHKPRKYKYEKGGGESFKENHHSSQGEKGDKGFKKHHGFEEDEMGHHGKEEKKGYYDNESGHKKSHHNEGDKYGKVYGKLHGEKGVKYGESEGHKKGHKTSGYHNIFHKDEFKKEHKFYDDAHKHGYHDKKGGFHTDHGKKHGHKATGGFNDSAFDYGHKGDSGIYKKGNFDEDHKGHKGSTGQESYYNHHEDYGKKGGHSDSKKFGFNHGH